MCNAAEVGHKHLVDFFISKGANDWKHGEVWAKKGGHKELFEFKQLCLKI